MKDDLKMRRAQRTVEQIKAGTYKMSDAGLTRLAAALEKDKKS